MLYSSLLVCASALATLVSAQAGNSTSSGGGAAGDMTECCNVLSTTVKEDLRISWCLAQTNSCPLLCPGGETVKNDCDNKTLTWRCECNKGADPNITDFAQTLPSLECDEWKNQCVHSHPDDLEGQKFCQSFICGHRNATEFAANLTANASAAAASSSAAMTTAAAASSTTESSPSATASKAAAAVLSVGREYGTGVLGVGMLALFGLAL